MSEYLDFLLYKPGLTDYASIEFINLDKLLGDENIDETYRREIEPRKNELRLQYVKERNFWICGFDNDAKKDFTLHDWEGRNVLLFGSEGYGLKHQTKKNSDFLLKIVINDKIESLNISNSASVVFHYINKMRKIN